MAALDEASWQQAAVMTGFTQREPMDGQPASERTEVRVVFDEEALFVGVWAFDSEPENITYGERIRDFEVTESDAIVFVLDTYNDDQNGFIFGTTPTGIEYDGQVANEGRGGGRFGGGGFNSRQRFQSGSGGGFNKNWDGSWTVATTTDGEGWYAEFRIPFNTLRYGNDAETWGFNVARRIRRLNEESFWTPVPREFNLYRLNYAGDLEGLRPPFQRLATMTPYVLGSTARDYTSTTETGFGQDGNVGGDVKFQVTQGLTLDVTYNTDFAQVEVDDQQLNLTRFRLNFPEKRPFFLENAGFFNVGGGGADLFFSRAIGIANGQPVPIKGGARLSGTDRGDERRAAAHRDRWSRGPAGPAGVLGGAGGQGAAQSFQDRRPVHQQGWTRRRLQPHLRSRRRAGHRRSDHPEQLRVENRRAGSRGRRVCLGSLHRLDQPGPRDYGCGAGNR